VMSLWLERPDFQLPGAQEFSRIRAVSAASGVEDALAAHTPRTVLGPEGWGLALVVMCL